MLDEIKQGHRKRRNFQSMQVSAKNITAKIPGNTTASREDSTPPEYGNF